MKKILFIAVAVLLLIMVLILIFSPSDTSHVTSNYSNIEIQMRKLWY